MSLESVYRARLAADSDISSAVGTRIWRGFRAAQTDLPCITIYRVSTTPENSNAGDVGVALIRLQIDIWADKASEARTIADYVRTSLDGFAQDSGPPINMTMLDNDTDIMEDPEGGGSDYVWRVSQDYMIWATA